MNVGVPIIIFIISMVYNDFAILWMIPLIFAFVPTITILGYLILGNITEFFSIETYSLMLSLMVQSMFWIAMIEFVSFIYS